MSKEAIDQFAAGQSAERAASVRLGSKAGHEKRTLALFGDYDDPNHLRTLAGQIKQHTIEHLDRYLEQATAQLESHGAHVHFAADAESACRQVAEILEARGAKRVVKAKTMVSEEIELAHYLEGKGIACVETDLGEFVVQINHDSPSHIVKPIIHMNRREVAVAFEQNGLGAYDDTPEVITRQAAQEALAQEIPRGGRRGDRRQLRVGRERARGARDQRGQFALSPRSRRRAATSSWSASRSSSRKTGTSHCS